MKSRLLITITALVVLFPVLLSAQTITINKKDLMVSLKKGITSYRIPVYAKGLEADSEVVLTIDDRNTGTAQRSKDYVLSVTQNTFKDTTELLLRVGRPDEIKETETVSVLISASAKGKVFYFQQDTITLKPIEVEPVANKERKLYKLDSTEFKLLTAGSLNFYGHPQFDKYVGQLDIRLPSLIELKNTDNNIIKALGLNVGVFTKNYYTDSLYRGMGTFNVRIPNDSLRYNTRTLNRFAKISYDLFGAYFNPTLLLIQKDKANGSGHFRLYLNGSLEILSTTAKTHYNYTLLDSTVNKYGGSTTLGNALSPKDPRIYQPDSKQTWITGFYGFGPQVYYQEKNLMDLNILFLGGWSITSLDQTQANSLYNFSAKTRQFYYLTKAVVTEKITKLNATIGVEVRGMVPNRTPSVAAYLGFLISPSDFFKK